MKKIVLLALGVATSLTAQVSKNVGDFNKLSVVNGISVELIPSDENRVEITGKRGKDVEVINNNGELRLRMKLDKITKGDEVDAKVYYSTLKSINAGQGSYVSSGETLKAKKIDLNSKEGSGIELNLDVEDVDTRSVTGGSIKLSGTATEIDASLGTGGILEARELRALKAEVSINAGGEASVYATDYVEAKVNAGGDIVIYGNPREVDEKTTLGGSIRRSN